MNSLSSGYAANANRSVSGTRPHTPVEDNGPDRSAPLSTTSQPPTARRNRIVAPPPTHYVSEAPINDSNGGESVTSHPSEPQGKMLFAYQANGEGELSVDEGQSVTIVEPDGRRLCLLSTAAATDFLRRVGVDERPAWFFQIWPCTSNLRRSTSPQPSNPTRASSIIILELIDITGRQYELAGKEKRSCGGTKTRGQEAKVC